MPEYIVTKAGIDACNQGSHLIEKLCDLLGKMSDDDGAVARDAFLAVLTDADGLPIVFKHEPPQQIAERERVAAEGAE